MSKKPNLTAFMASKANASPAPLDYAPPPAAANEQPAAPAETAPVRQEATTPKAAEESVPMTFRVEKSFRKMLKQYAASLEKPMVEIIREGIELHRQKHGGMNG